MGALGVDECCRFLSVAEGSERYPLFAMAMPEPDSVAAIQLLRADESGFTFYLKFSSH
jgi:hypothetical protein